LKFIERAFHLKCKLVAIGKEEGGGKGSEKMQ